LAIPIKTFSSHGVLRPDGRLVNDLNENIPIRIGRLFAFGEVLEDRHGSSFCGSIPIVLRFGILVVPLT
jgi:hypothetical protein